MLFIHESACISPQQSFGRIDLDRLVPSANSRMIAIEPDYKGIPPGQLRRMGKAVRMGIGAALSLAPAAPFEGGIIVGSGNGGMEDSIQFLHQLVEYQEGLLTPGHFVQSTANAVASQIGLIIENHAYNSTHAHRGLAFEHALLDAQMLSREFPEKMILLGAVDEIADHHYNIERLEGSYKDEAVSNDRLYAHETKGSMAGEGAVMFAVNGLAPNAIAQVELLETVHTEDPEMIKKRIARYMESSSFGQREGDMLLCGENGDTRLKIYYEACLSMFGADLTVARFKHMSGEYPTAAALACWLSCQLIQSQHLPDHMVIKRPPALIRRILLYNSYKGCQHSFLLVSAVN